MSRVLWFVQIIIPEMIMLLHVQVLLAIVNCVFNQEWCLLGCYAMWLL
jgi:hypothetical protein